MALTLFPELVVFVAYLSLEAQFSLSFLEATSGRHTDADPASHRVRLWRGGSASSLFFYLFVYSFIEYVDLDALAYLKAPGPYYGAEGRWRNVVPDRFGLCLRAAVLSVSFFVVNNIFLLSFNN